MRRLLLLLVPFLLAACGGGSTGPDDDLPDSLGPARFWDGTARFARTTSAGGFVDVVSFVGTVRFGTTDRGAPPYGYTIVSGTMNVLHQGDLAGACTISGQTDFSLGPGDGSFVMFSGGQGQYSQYLGSIRKEVTFNSVVECPGSRPRNFPDSASIDLEIEGTLLGGRISGTMAPTTAGQSRFEGAWNLTPVD